MQKAFKACALVTLLCVPLPLLAQADNSSEALVQKVGGNASTAYYILHHPRVLAAFLSLSPAQTTGLMGFWKTLQSTEQPLAQARVPLCQQLRTDLAANPPEASAVGTDTVNLFDNKGQRETGRMTFDTSFSAILNPTQLALYNSLKVLAREADPDYNVIGECPPPS